MSNGLGLLIESVVAVLLLLTITFCIVLNKRLKKLRADEQALKGTISELITATEIAERAIAGLKMTVRDCDQNLGERLRAGEGLARRVLTGAAWMYLHDARGRMPDESDFADVHGLDAQRYYNVLCMAHGSDPEAFQGMVDKGYLPKERAEVCADEFRQVAYAVTKLIDPSVDAALAEEIKAAHKARWEAPRKLDPPPATVKH